MIDLLETWPAKARDSDSIKVARLGSVETSCRTGVLPGGVAEDGGGAPVAARDVLAGGRGGNRGPAFIVSAFASAWPEPRKQLPPRASKLDPFKFAHVILAQKALKDLHGDTIVRRVRRGMIESFGQGTEVVGRRTPVSLAAVLPDAEDVTAMFPAGRR